MKIGQVFCLTFWNSAKLVLNSQVQTFRGRAELGALIFSNKVMFFWSFGMSKIMPNPFFKKRV